MNRVLHSDWFVEEGEYIYFSSKLSNGLYRCRINEWNTEFLGFFPGENSRKKGIQCRTVLSDGLLCFSPQNASLFHTYNLKRKQFRSYDILNDKSKEYKYLSMALNNEKLYLLPYNSKEMIVLNYPILLNDDCDSDGDCVLERRDIGVHVTHAIGCVDKYVYAATTEDSNSIIRIDTYNNQVKRIPIDGYQDGFECMIYSAGKLLISSRKKGAIFEYDIDKGIMDRIYESSATKVETFIDINDKVMITHGGMSDFLIYNKNKGNIIRTSIDGDNFLKKKDYHFAFGKRVFDGSVILMCRFDMDISLIQISPDLRTIKKVILEEPPIERPYRMFLEEETRQGKANIIDETYSNDLDNYFSMVINGENG